MKTIVTNVHLYCYTSIVKWCRKMIYLMDGATCAKKFENR